MKKKEPRLTYQPAKIIYISLEIPNSKLRLIKHKKWKEIIHQAKDYCWYMIVKEGKGYGVGSWLKHTK